MVRGAVVQKLCEYMAFRSCYENAGPKEDVPVMDFTERIPPEVALELLVFVSLVKVESSISLHPAGCWLQITWKVAWNRFRNSEMTLTGSVFSLKTTRNDCQSIFLVTTVSTTRFPHGHRT
jgi:hypothetical protein